MSEHKNLSFFNGKGDNLNFRYDDDSEIFQGDILFDENSTDTFKTSILYTMERVESFELDSIDLGTNKFQLFNEFGIKFYGNKNIDKYNISRIEPVNNDSNFYSKWIYGDNFESLFKIGSLIRFDSSILEFSNTEQVFVVISSKKNAIMIISNIDNLTFENTYYSIYMDKNTFYSTISSVNSIGIHNYINSNYENNISMWSEPNFYDKLYVGKKINIVNSELNDGIITISNPNITDMVHFEYLLNILDVPINSDKIIIELLIRSDLPKVYDGGINIKDNRLYIDNLLGYTKYLKSGQEFKIVGSLLNTNFLTTLSLVDFDSNNTTTFYSVDEQINYNGVIYQCIESYTHSHVDELTRFIKPNNSKFWSIPTFIEVNESLVNEELLKSQLYLTKEKYYFEYKWEISSDVTLAKISEKFKSDFRLFGINLHYDNGYLKSDLLYPSSYIEINYYIDSIDIINNRVEIYKTNERLIETDEIVETESNNNISSIFKYNIVFTDIDEYGLKVVINKQIYDIEISYVRSGDLVDMNRTIDRTLRNWLSRYYYILFKLGINVELHFTGNYTSVFYNSIYITTEYPNVEFIINDILVGTTANYYIEHSKVLFTKVGPVLDIVINNKSYLVKSILGIGGDYDVSDTLNYWVSTYSVDLEDYGIFIKNFNNLLKFDIKTLERRLEYIIRSGNVSIPGLSDYKRIDKIKGNLGVLLSSNEVILSPTSSINFEKHGFSTGMVLSINNTNHTLMNREFVINFLDPNVLGLSYEGPFWDINNTNCYKSPFVTIAFNSGFGQTGCGPLLISGQGGEFDINEFNFDEFNMIKYQNTYDVKTYDGISGMVDIKYVQLSNSVLVFGDNVVILDSYFGTYINTIMLPGNTHSIKMEYNLFNDYMYCLSSNSIWVIDPLINIVITNIPLSGSASDLIINSSNGDVYISYNNISSIDIFKSTSFSPTPDFIINTSASSNGMMVFNEQKQSIYLVSDIDIVYEIDGKHRIISSSYSIPNLKNYIFYEPSNESIFVDALPNMWIIDNGFANMSTYESNIFIDMIYNNLTGEIQTSESSNNFIRMDLTGNVIKQTNISNFGYMSLNPYDGGVYISSQYTNSIVVVDSISTELVYLNSTGERTTKIIYNPDRRSTWAIQPSTNKVIEIEVQVNTTIIDNKIKTNIIKDNMYGSLDTNFINRDNMWLKTRDYYRRPRSNFEGDARSSYYFKWLSDNVGEFFLYDFSGEQLKEIQGSYSYIGDVPLSNVILNRLPNRDITKISNPLYQQTIFNKVGYKLGYIDDSSEITSLSEPLQLFIGFRSNDEGALRSILQLYKHEDVNFVMNGDELNEIQLYTIDDSGDRKGIIKISDYSNLSFYDRGLKVGQHIVIYLNDITNNKNQYISNNNGTLLKIREVYSKTIVVDFFNIDTDILEFESTTTTNGYLSLGIKVKDKEIGRFFTYGQTEEEDVRFKIELGNIGKLIEPNDVFIFKQYDIEEGGVDWLYLNKKRKEMLMMKHLIYPYIGSYKSIINAINFFGYNDLKLNEYYKNIDSESENFFKLFKVEIPDIFDNSTSGWSDNDYVKLDDKFEATNMFNLTYDITDKDGDYKLEYSIDEIIIKLQGLKYWLKKNIIPLTHKILDITGNMYFNTGTQISHKLNNMRIININDSLSPITFKLNESYLLPVNSGSSVYNCVLDFSIILDDIDYFNIDIKTYKTYKEWVPFKSYSIGSKVTYYDKIYESVIDNNNLNNPREYELVSNWNTNSVYDISDIVRYQNSIYSLSMTSSLKENPSKNNNWLIVNKWREINMEPVQSIKEYRAIENKYPFNFTLDSNIDPFVVISVSSDNGYGCSYIDTKYYEIKGVSSVIDKYKTIENIGPFEPIILK